MIAFARVDEVPWWVYVVMPVAMLVIALWMRKSEIGDFERLIANDWASRALGLFAIAMGALIGYAFVYQRIRDALGQSRMFDYRFGLVVFSVGPIAFGSILFLAGRNAGKFVIARHDRTPTGLQWAVMWIGIGGCLALELAFQFWLRSLGYRIGAPS